MNPLTELIHSLEKETKEKYLLRQILNTCDLANGSNINKCRYGAQAFFEDELPKILKYLQQVEKLRTAIEFYANKKHFTWDEVGEDYEDIEIDLRDDGKVAREALDSFSQATQ